MLQWINLLPSRLLVYKKIWIRARLTSLICIELRCSRVLQKGVETSVTCLREVRGCLGNFLCCWIILCDIVNGSLISKNLTSFIFVDMVRRGYTSSQGRVVPWVPHREQPPEPIAQRLNASPLPQLEAPVPPIAFLVTLEVQAVIGQL